MENYQETTKMTKTKEKRYIRKKGKKRKKKGGGR